MVTAVSFELYFRSDSHRMQYSSDVTPEDDAFLHAVGTQVKRRRADRGLTLGQARHAILEGFFEEVLVKFGVPDVTQVLRDELHRLIGGEE